MQDSEQVHVHGRVKRIPSLGKTNGVHPGEYVLVVVVVGFAQIWRGVTRGASSMVRHNRRLQSPAAADHVADHRSSSGFSA